MKNQMIQNLQENLTSWSVTINLWQYKKNLFLLLILPLLLRHIRIIYKYFLRKTRCKGNCKNSCTHWKLLHSQLCLFSLEVTILSPSELERWLSKMSLGFQGMAFRFKVKVPALIKLKSKPQTKPWIFLLPLLLRSPIQLVVKWSLSQLKLPKMDYLPILTLP